MPQLDIVGAAAGGVPVDLFHNLTYIDHPSSSRGSTIPVFIGGLSRAFEIRNLDQYLTPQGIAVVNANKAQCSGGFTGLTTQQMFKPQYQDLTKVPVFARMINTLIMGRTGTPRTAIARGWSRGLDRRRRDRRQGRPGAVYTYCQRVSRSSFTSTTAPTTNKRADRSFSELGSSSLNGSRISGSRAAAPTSVRVTPLPPSTVAAP